VNAVLGEGFGESDPAHSTLLHAATSGSPPTGPAQKRAPVRMLREAETVPEPKGYLCVRYFTGRYFTGQVGAFNLHAARRVAPNDKQGREMLCRYILRPPLANERLHLLADGSVTVEFKRRVPHSPGRMGRAASDWLPRVKHPGVALAHGGPGAIPQAACDGVLGGFGFE